MKILLRVGLILGLLLLSVLVLSFLGAMFRREAVKQDLSCRGCAAVRIWWIPIAAWFYQGARTYFSVTYRDPGGLLHKARCYVYVSLMSSPFGPQSVEWTKDEIRNIVDT